MSEICCSETGHSVIQQVKVPVVYEEVEIISALRLDLLVNEFIVVEIKTVENILSVHEAQLLTYMKLLKKPQGLLIHFYTDNVVKGMKPMVNEHFKALPD